MILMALLFTLIFISKPLANEPSLSFPFSMHNILSTTVVIWSLFMTLALLNPTFCPTLSKLLAQLFHDLHHDSSRDFSSSLYCQVKNTTSKVLQILKKNEIVMCKNYLSKADVA